MMKNLLEHDFIAHHKLTTKTKVTVNVAPTKDTDFDLKDDATIVYPSGSGIAKYHNPNSKEVKVINYESFFKSLPQSFQNNKDNCDLIIYTSDFSHFILNELTDKGKKKGKKRTHAVAQMLQVLRDICAVPAISSFIGQYTIKRCCYFNKKAQAPSNKINATTTFNRLSTIAPNGFQMSTNSSIAALGFELWEFSGNQTYLLQ